MCKRHGGDQTGGLKNTLAFPSEEIPLESGPRSPLRGTVPAQTFLWFFRPSNLI